MIATKNIIKNEENNWIKEQTQPRSTEELIESSFREANYDIAEFITEHTPPSQETIPLVEKK